MKKSKRVVTILAAFILVLGVSKIIYAECSSSEKQARNKRSYSKYSIEPVPTKAQFAKASLVEDQTKTSDVSAGLPKLVTSIPYGNGDGQVGLKWTGSPDNLAIGPDNFTIGKEAIYLHDVVNKRIQIYGLDGDYKRTIGMSAENFVIDDNGFLYLTTGDQILTFSPEGKQVGKLNKGEEEDVINEIIGNVLYSYNELDGYTTEIAKANKGIVTTTGNSQDLKRIGKVTKSGNFWKVSKKSKDTAVINQLDENNKYIKTVEYSHNGLLDFVFVDEDSKGNLFIDMGRQVAVDKAVGETLVLNAQGEEIKRIPQKMPICWVSKNIEVTSDDSVWQVVPEKDGLNIYRWEN